MEEDLKKAWRESITRLTIIIGKQLKMEKEDQWLMMLCLDTPRKIKRFSDWAKTKTVNNKLNSTPEEVMHIVTLIAKGRALTE